MATKKAEETKEVVETTEQVKAEETKVNQVEFRTGKKKNFVGFVHPETRRLITVDEKGKLFIDETDTKALAILRAAADLNEF